jgi:uncharacterized protein with FMN-binding domain
MLGSAAVMTVYAAGFARTQAAAQRLEAGSDARRWPPAAGAERGGVPAAAAPRHDENGIVSGAALPGGPAQAVAGTAASAPVTAASAPRETPSVTRDAAPPAVVELVKAHAAEPGAPPVAAATSQAPSAPTATLTASAPAPVSAPPAAPTSAPASSATPASAPSSAPVADSARSVGWRDGTYTGWGTSRHGDIEATVVVENGKITGAIISRCLTRYSCSWVAHLQAQVVARQSPEVDNVSGATQSANAFYYAVVDALAKAK